MDKVTSLFPQIIRQKTKEKQKRRNKAMSGNGQG
jgi:hypothetical protein